MTDSERVILHVEIRQKAESSVEACEIKKEVNNFLSHQNELIPGGILTGEVLPEHIACIRICSDSEEKYNLKLSKDSVDMRFYVYQTCSAVPQYDTLDEEDDSTPACLNWLLPNLEFEGLWESLILDSDLKSQLLNYMETALLYSQNQVSAQIIRWNGVVLLHGPPGTGKTSLCKALAQKLSIRLGARYKSGQLIEINTHSLFSKWYSESPKLVFKMFKTIKQWLDYEENFVCILIDEVESLTHARQNTGSEPADSIRVVNTVLTQLDQLQRYRNFIILATSNVTDSIDIAFADRADLKLFLGYPNKWGVYEILRSCIEELIRCQLISSTPNGLFDANILKKLNNTVNGGHLMTEVISNSNNLLELSTLCEGLSGRTLRKIPFLTSTRFVDKPNPNIKNFLSAMKQIVVNHKNDNRKYFKGKSYHLSNGIN